MSDADESAVLLKELVSDAKRVAAYGQRTGRLQDYTLLSDIADVDALPELTWRAPEIVKLQTSLNRSMQLLAPTNLADLKSEWNPFTTTSKASQLAFVLVTLVLMAITALATFEYNKGTSLLKGIEDLQKEDVRAEIGSIIRQLLAVNTAAANAVSTTGADQAVAANAEAKLLLDEPHFALIDRLHAIDSRLEFYLPQLSQFRLNHQLPHEVVGSAVADLQRIAGGFFSSAVAGTPNATPPSKPDLSKLPASGQFTCEDLDNGRATYKTEFGATPIASVLVNYLTTVMDIICAERIAYPPNQIPSYSSFIEDMRSWSNIWGLWYLPSLYGALGAMLFYMRRILDPTLPDPSAIRIIQRTALGAFAGVIVTWFWAPNSTLNEGFTSVGITVFTLAFLIGFSIEVLFALLDRFVGTLIDLAKGTDKARPPATSS